MHRPNKKMKTSAGRNAEDVGSGAAGSMIAPTETKSVASNSLSASIGSYYEVFLSFRGPDTRKGFTDHLYYGLVDAGIDAFRDDEELRQGENIGPELLAAITNSKILIPIISVNYGTSSWCLDELVQIMECKNNNGRTVLPIFYKVKPANLRHQTGSFGDAFAEHERRLRGRSPFDSTILGKWKKALNEVSTLKGYEADGSEGKLVKSVVQKVLSELKKKFELVIPENLVGIDGHVEEVMRFVDNNSNATLFIGIHGMGGIGKTTLAKTIYNKLFNQFKYHSFIADIRESCKRNGIEYLQNQLISDILNQKKQASNKDDGIQFISSKFKDKKVLILLDDVDDDDQLKALVGNHNWFSSRSRIFITTRNNSVLDNGRVDFKYEHEVMDKNDSMVLFSRHAFRSNSPPSKFEDLAHDVITTTGGLPLPIEVLGSSLCGKSPAFWRGTIDKLKKVPHKKVREKLRISYEELDYGQKQIFLDIACFFIGTERGITSYMWDACDFFPYEGIEVLKFMSLIKIGDNHEFIMHDQLRDLGREIVREENQQEPHYRSRLWDSKEVLKVLKENKGTNKIEAIDLSERSQRGSIYTEKQFKNLTRLRFLYLNGAHLSGDFKDSMEELRWLRWRSCPMTFEVNNFHVKELAVIELQFGKINEKWGGWSFFRMAEKLKYLDLSYCYFLRDTDFLSAFKKLEVLILNKCSGLKRIDASIGEMEALLRLELHGCSSLTKLPTEIGELKALQQLLLQETKSLSALPDSIGCLENLEILDISWSRIEELPNGIGRLRQLRELRAPWCNNLKGIMAKSMCNLSSLRRLDFLFCYQLQSLPDLPSGLIDFGVTCQSRELPSLSHLAHLKKLRVSDCRFLKCIQVLPSTQLKSSECSQPTDIEESKSPQSLNMPSKLEFLEVFICGSIETLDISQFIHLRKLSVSYCENLLEVRGIDKLIYLESLTIVGWNSIEQLDLPKFEALKKLEAGFCEKLVEIQGLDRLEYLERLEIQWCTSIKRLDLPKSRMLKELKAENSKNLVEIQGLDRLEYLERLNIEGCASIKRLDLPKSGMLKELKAIDCENLTEIQGLEGSEYLERLDTNGCISMERLYLPKSGRLKELEASGCTSKERLYLSKSRRLKELQASGCKKLAEIQGLNRSEYLEKLVITWFTSMERLYLPKYGKLKELQVSGCEKLVEIQGLDGLEYLEMLSIWCTSMEKLYLPKSGRLKDLYAKGCKNLAEIQGLDSLECLESLYISGCASIRRLDLPKSGSMKTFYANSCKKLAEIQDLDRLESLEKLDISRCTSIERLLLPKSKSLKILKAKECANLIEIQGLDMLEFLKELNIIGCKSLKTIPELSGTCIYRYYEITDGKTTRSILDYMDDSDE